MDHQTIEQEEIIERYILGKLSKKDEREFEEHFFGCDQCFEAVQEMEQIVSGVREAVKKEMAVEKVKVRQFDFGAWLESILNRLFPIPAPTLAAITAILVLALLYPAWRGIFKINRLEKQLTELSQPQVNVPSYYLPGMRFKDRAASQVTTVEISRDKPQQTFVLSFNILEQSFPAPKYRVEIINNEEGKMIWRSKELSPMGEYGNFSIACPGAFFKAGKYILKVYESDSETQKQGKEFSFQFEIINK